MSRAEEYANELFNQLNVDFSERTEYKEALEATINAFQTALDAAEEEEAKEATSEEEEEEEEEFEEETEEEEDDEEEEEDETELDEGDEIEETIPSRDDTEKD